MSGRTVMVTGLTGSFGKTLLRTLLADPDVGRVVAFSRDELKQFVLQNELGSPAKVKWVLGDVRDRDSLVRAARGVSVLVHAAALKQIVACERNPLEAIKTNVIGAANVIQAAVENGVEKVIGLSTDKAVNPFNLYGATKLCAERLLATADSTISGSRTRFAAVRWGNVLGSRGSVIPFFLSRRSTGRLPITDLRMTRFWITLEQAVAFVLRSVDLMQGGEVFVPKVPSMSVVDVARTLAPDAQLEVIGIRPGEKLHEVLVTRDEARNCLELADGYVIYSELKPRPEYLGTATRPVPEDWEYNSGSNDSWLSGPELLALLASTRVEPF
ncbi:MAG: polysaccharide biosynthesis protein [Gemmatimonadota bacterium]